MTRPPHGKEAARRLLGSMIGLATCVLSAQCLAAEDASSSNAQNATKAAESTAPKSTQGMTIYVDPQTGAIRSTPAPGTQPLTLSPQEQNALSTSHQGLFEVPNTAVSGGGVKLDLQGRFMSPLVVTVGPDGKVRMQHVGEHAGAPEQ